MESNTEVQHTCSNVPTDGDQPTKSSDGGAYFTKQRKRTLNYADMESIKAAGNFNFEGLAKQQTMLQQIEVKQKNSKHRIKSQQVHAELGIEDSQILDSLVLDRDVQKQLLDAASFHSREEDMPQNKHSDVLSSTSYASNSPATKPQIDDL